MQEEIAASIRQRLSGEDDALHVDVVVEGNRAVITVVSGLFEGMTRVRKQQTVYGCIDAFIQDGRLHAVSIRALTPDEAAGSSG
jgi:acid stress-induced BolA-like protein IbaG/YrbA